jgi:signal transduction histidine kinase/CheY-like chemotaxis protein
MMSKSPENPYFVAHARERLARLQTEAELETLTRNIYLKDDELRRSYESLLIATVAAQDAKKIKEQFIANMSHEIRTPMNAILGMLRLCLQTELNDKQRQYIEKISLASQGLQNIVNDILDFSQIEAGNLSLTLAPFELQASLDILDASAWYIAQSKHLDFTISVGPDVPQYLVGDSIRLGQVLLNLTSNSVKFTATGSVSVFVSLREATAEEVELEFEVHDTGIGLSPEQTQGLFSGFSQVDMSTTRKFGGTGLGLAISKRLVELMGGRLWVESSIGVGSIFFFTAYFGRRDVQQSIQITKDEEAQIEGGALQGMRILVAEDNEFNQDVIREILEQWGVEVSISGNGFEALQQLTEESYDIVLMDVQMPLMDGYEATRKIRATPSLAGQCVIAITANVLLEDRQRCMEAGMNDVEPKPIEQSHLYQTLVHWVPEVDPIDLTVLRRLLKDDSIKVKKFAEKFLQASRTVLAEMLAAQESGDLATLSRLGHKHKSASASVGAVGLVALCLALEDVQNSGSDDEQVGLLLAQIQNSVDRVALQLESELG